MHVSNVQPLPQILPVPEVDLETIDIQDRIRLLDADGAVRRTLREIWPYLVNDLSVISQKCVDNYFRIPEVAQKLNLDMRPMLEVTVATYLSAHYQDFLSPTWAELAAALGDQCMQLQIPIRSMLSSINWTSQIILTHLAPVYAQDPQKAALWPIAILTSVTSQLELATTRIVVRTKKAEMTRLAAQSSAFQHDVQAVVHGINDATAIAKSRTSEMEGLGHAMLQRSAEVAAAAGQSASSMNEAAKTSVTLATEIGRALDLVRDSSVAFDKALVQVEDQMGSATKLEASSEQIASIVDLIRQVAQRTNLLALNATIEAARAGEAGRGFSVVAQEVKSLANQTTSATNDIAKRISELQLASADTVKSYGEISKIVQSLQQSSSTLAKRMDQHGSLLDVITSHVTETARTAETTSNNIDAVSESAQLVARQLSDMRASHADLEQQMATLRKATDGFLQKLAA
jgi:methyl-accepting chemotaxis protein